MGLQLPQHTSLRLSPGQLKQLRHLELAGFKLQLTGEQLEAHPDIRNTVQPGADLSALLQLPDSCTSLVVGGAAFSDAAAVTVAQLTQLKDLRWCYSEQLTDTGLEQLTALDLWFLYVHNCNPSRDGYNIPGLSLACQRFGPHKVGQCCWPALDVRCGSALVCKLLQTS